MHFLTDYRSHRGALTVMSICISTSCWLQLGPNSGAGQVLWAAHAGDSRAVLCRNGTSLCMTQDHKPELKFERARVEENGGKVEFQRYSLTAGNVEAAEGLIATGKP